MPLLPFGSPPGVNTIKRTGSTALKGNVTLSGGTNITLTQSGQDISIAASGGVTPAALTKTDDTNVTLTLGGTPATALLQATSLTLGWTGTLSGTRGGTGVNNGASTITIGGGLTFSGAFTTAITVTAATTVTLPTSGTLYGTLANSITSAQMLSSISDETGTGVLVFGTSPTFTTNITTPTILGGSASGGNLLLQSTSNATRGFVQVEGFLQVGTTTQAAGATNIFYVDLATSGAVSVTTGSIAGVRFVPTITVKGTSTNPLMALFNSQPTAIIDDGTARSVGPSLVFASQHTYTATIAGGLALTDLAGIPAYTGLYYSLTTTITGAGTGTIATAAGVYISGIANIGAGWTITNYYGLLFNPPTIGGTITNIAVIKSTLAAATNRFFLQDTGGAQSQLAGVLGLGIAPSSSTALVMVGSTTAKSSLRITHGAAPTTPVDGDMWTTTAGAFIRINGVTKTFTLT